MYILYTAYKYILSYFYDQTKYLGTQHFQQFLSNTLGVKYIILDEYYNGDHSYLFT